MYTGAAVILVKFENKSDIVGNRCSIIMVGSTSSTVVDELLILRALSACDLIGLLRGADLTMREVQTTMLMLINIDLHHSRMLDF